jgi:hypothetical protein
VAVREVGLGKFIAALVEQTRSGDGALAKDAREIVLECVALRALASPKCLAFLLGCIRCVWSLLQHSPGKHWRFTVKLPGNAAVISNNAPVAPLHSGLGLDSGVQVAAGFWTCSSSWR